MFPALQPIESEETKELRLSLLETMLLLHCYFSLRKGKCSFQSTYAPWPVVAFKEGTLLGVVCTDNKQNCNTVRVINVLTMKYDKTSYDKR